MTPHVPLLRYLLLRSRALWVVGWAWVGMSLGAHVLAQAPDEALPHYQVKATYDSDRQQIDVDWTLETKVDESGDVRLWLYFDRLGVPPGGLNEQSARWIFPNEVDLSKVALRTIEVNGVGATWHWVNAGRDRSVMDRDHAGRDIVIQAKRGVGKAVVHMAYSFRVPERFGRIGRVGDQASFAAPWYPLLVEAHDSQVARARHRVTVQTSAVDWSVLLGQSLGKHQASSDSFGVYTPLVVAPGFNRAGFEQRSKANTTKPKMVSTHPIYRAPAHANEKLSTLRDALRIDTYALAARVVEQLRPVCDSIAWLKCRAPLLVVVPSRTELAATAPGWVMISDRLYEILQIEATRHFHDDVLALMVLRSWLESSEYAESASNRDWSIEARAILLKHVADVARSHRSLSPAQLIGFAAFHPSVDDLLYATQIAYKGAFFAAADAPVGLADDVARARRGRVSGAKVIENLRIILSKKAYAGFTSEVLLRDEPMRDVIARYAPSFSPLVPAWLSGQHGPVNFRLGTIKSQHVGALYQNEIEVVREKGFRADPIHVLVIDEDGRAYGLTWDGLRKRDVLYVETKAPIDKVTLDPEGLETQTRTAGHPRADDTTALRGRPPLLQGFDLNASVADHLVTGFVEVAMRKRYVMEHAFVLRASQGIASTGGSLRYVYGFGPKVHDNRRSMTTSVGTFFNRFRSGFTDAASAGVNYGVRLGVAYDTRYFLQDPRMGDTVAASLELSRVDPDGGSASIASQFNTRAGHYFALGLRHALLVLGDFGATFGARLPGQKQVLGGPFALRGYSVEALVDSTAAMGVVEYRYSALSDLHWNILQMGWVRELQLATFMGAGTLGPTLGNLFDRQAAQAGVGLRIHGDYGGVQPAVFSIDVGFPLMKDEATRGRSPYFVYFGFDQYF